jgi:hypothetical protein
MAVIMMSLVGDSALGSWVGGLDCALIVLLNGNLCFKDGCGRLLLDTMI